MPSGVERSSVASVSLLAGCRAVDNTSTTSAPSVTTASVPKEASPTADATPPSTAASGGQESLAPVSAAFKVCTDCHADFNGFLKDSKSLTTNFSHGSHLNQGVTCEDCHTTPPHQPDKIVLPTMESCFKCHNQEPDAKAPGACSTCHPSSFPLVPANHNGGGWLPVANPGLVKTVSARHAPLAKEDVSYCKMCHATSFCNDCHQVQMPHPADWQQAHPQASTGATGQTCEKCHPQQYLCNDCHHTGFKPGTSWTQQHPPIVTAGGTQAYDACLTCHSPLTCAHCHTQGEFKEFGPSSPAGGASAPTTGTTQPSS